MNSLDYFLPDLALAHPSWRAVLRQALQAIHVTYPNYISELTHAQFLPTQHRLFAAFSIPLAEVKFVLVGEGPYPRDLSATGYCFMDGAVNEIWSNEKNAGLSKTVNRATSLRNFIKMLLLADGRLSNEDTGIGALAPIAQQFRASPEYFVQTMSQLQENFLRQGFLMLNASLVFRNHVAPSVDAKVWQVFLEVILKALSSQKNKPALILWGKIADRLAAIPNVSDFEIIASEHPYNLSFIQNAEMHQLFAPLKLLYR
jgi:uracil-DNA glycosylase